MKNTMTNVQESFKALKVTDERSYNSILSRTPRTGLSSKYVHLNSKQIIQRITEFGWIPVQAEQARSKAYAGFQKHIVQFENDQYKLGEENIRIVMLNSHDGRSSLQFKIGIFRIVCTNGLITGQEFQAVKLRHRKITREDVDNTIIKLMDFIPKVTQNIEAMKNTYLSATQILAMANQALKIRLGDKFEAVKVSPVKVVEPTRYADKKATVWNVYNVIQEKLAGNKKDLFITYTNEKNQVRKLSTIKNIDRNLKLNADLFDLAMNAVNN